MNINTDQYLNLYRCSIPGHYIGDCPTIAGQANTGTGLNVPPPGYICKKCSIPGHYVSDCPGGLGQHLGGNQQLASGPAPGNTPPPGYLCKKYVNISECMNMKR